jgi:hypothetical protein
MKIFLKTTKDELPNNCLSEEQLFQKNKIILNNVRNFLFLNKIDENYEIVLNNLLKYFEEIEEYKYCRDILKIKEMNFEIFSN